MLIIPESLKLKNQLALKFVSLLILAIGLTLIAEVLFAKAPTIKYAASKMFISRAANVAPLVIGLSFVYLAFLLRRRKKAAWIIATVIFSVYFIAAVTSFSVSDIALSALGLFGLVYYRREFVVKSGLASNYLIFRNIAIGLILMLLYGAIGFALLDESAFGRQITFWQSINFTADAYRLFGEPLKPLTNEGRFLLDSLYVFSLMTYVYIVVNLFGPIKEHYLDLPASKTEFNKLLDLYSADSEDYFKLWPSDKHYIVVKQAGIAYKTVSGIALAAGDPVGKKSEAAKVVKSFVDLCHINDWTVAFVHIGSTYHDIYRDNGLEIQKIGEEAVINLVKFAETTARNKHFRNIRNRFEALGYSAELQDPPHTKALIDAAKRISNSWLSMPGKTERGFMLGYFDEEYLNQCRLFVAKDEAGQIVGFTNLVPVKNNEANIDMMRHLSDSVPNLSDFMFIELFLKLKEEGYKTLNMGLCPLAGIDDKDEESTVLAGIMKFVYQNGNRIYGFSGLERFKNKFEPEWRNRYVAYQDGIIGFTRTMNALNKALKK